MGRGGGRVLAGARRPPASGYRKIHPSDETTCCSHEAPSTASAIINTPRYTTRIATIHWFRRPRPEGGARTYTPGRWRVPHERFIVLRSPPRFRACIVAVRRLLLRQHWRWWHTRRGLKRVPRRKGLALLSCEEDGGWWCRRWWGGAVSGWVTPYTDDARVALVCIPAALEGQA